MSKSKAPMPAFVTVALFVLIVIAATAAVRIGWDIGGLVAR